MADEQTLLKAAMDMYQAQYTATDKLWGSLLSRQPCASRLHDL